MFKKKACKIKRIFHLIITKADKYNVKVEISSHNNIPLLATTRG
jgi:hypothetical protein